MASCWLRRSWTDPRWTSSSARWRTSADAWMRHDEIQRRAGRPRLAVSRLHLVLVRPARNGNIVMKPQMTPVSSSVPHDHPVEIERSDIDFMGHVNNAIYLKWVQSAVLAHWERFAPADAIAAHRWVAVKHEIVYRKPAFLEDEVVATVLLHKVQGVRALYRTVIRRGEEVLAEIKSSWCCLDAKTLRPKRLAESIIRRFFA